MTSATYLFFFFLGPKENGTESQCMHARRGVSDEDWDRVRRVFIRCIEVSQSRLIYMLISEQTTTLNELILICTLTYELTQLLSRIYISLKPGEFEYVSHFQVWTAHELDLLLFFPTSSGTVKAELRGLFKTDFSATGALMFAHPLQIWIYLMCFLVL